MEIVRCFHCNKAYVMDEVLKAGACDDCGSRRMRTADRLKDEEMEAFIARGLDPAAEGWGKLETTVG